MFFVYNIVYTCHGFFLINLMTRLRLIVYTCHVFFLINLMTRLRLIVYTCHVFFFLYLYLPLFFFKNKQITLYTKQTNSGRKLLK